MKPKLLAGIISAGLIWNSSALALDIPPEILNEIQQYGTARIIVELDMPWQPEGLLRTAEAVVVQRTQLTDTQQQFVTQLSQDLVNSRLFDDVNSADGTPIVKPETTYETIPYLVLEVSDATLPLVQQQTLTKGLTLDHADEPSLTQSLPLIGADKVWTSGYTGNGQQIAVLDTGVEKSHPFFATNRVVQEACFSATLCPDGQKQQVSAGAAVPCNYDAPNCLHGTHVAGIAASVAKDAQLIAVQVFSKQFGMAKSLQSDQLAALDWLHKTYGQLGTSLAAVNLSIGSGKFTSACDDDPRKKAIDNLRSIGIATIISSGKQGYTDAINAPACISSAISVGSTDKTDTLATDSNSASFLSLLAPGVDIVSSLPGGLTGAMTGTSMATPHVAGAWAVLKAAKPTATVDEVLTTLQTTGKAVSGKGVTKARVQLDKALGIQPTGCDLIKDGLVACYPFDGDANDGSGNGNHGTVKGGATLITDRFGSPNSAYRLDGINGYIEAADSPSLNVGTSDYSMAMWVRYQGTGQLDFWSIEGVLLDKREPVNAKGFSFYFFGPGQMGTQIADNGKYHLGNFNEKAVLEDGQWHHVVATVERKSTTGLKLYLDGRVITTRDPTPFAGSLDSPGTFKVGHSYAQQPYPAHGFLNGSVDDVRLYKRALSETEVKLLANVGPKTTLITTKIGNGTGEIKSADGAIACGSTCQSEYAIQRVVTLTANATAGSIFKGWSGDCGNGGNAIIKVTMDKAKSCTATFEQGTSDCDMVREGLVACYPFDGNANDGSGYGNHGTLRGGATLTTDRLGNLNSAYRLDGINGYIEAADSPSLNVGTSDYSMAMWVRYQGTGQLDFWSIEGVLLDKREPVNAKGFSFYFFGPGQMGTQIADNGKYHSGNFNEKAVLEDGQWHHVVATVERKSTTGLKLYLDGRVITTRDPTPFAGSLDSPGTFKVGHSYASQPYPAHGFLNGSVDDVRLYKRALSEAEVKQLAGIEPPKVTLTVTKTGDGTVTAQGINCGTDCTEDLAPNTSVTLMATPTSSTTFQSWTGDCTGTNATVTLTLDQAKTCTATFAENKYPLTVTTTGNGTVTGPGDYLPNTPATLTATPATGYTFKEWTGDCTGTTSPLTVTMDKAKTCGATFEILPTGLPLTVNKADDGRGRLMSRLRGETTSLTCDSACQTASYNYPQDGVVIVTATAEKGYEFKTWSCTGSSYVPGTSPNIIKVTMTSATTCTANFDPIIGELFSLTVNLIGTGMGSVTPSKAGLECQDSQCTGVYAKDTKLTLTAKPSPFATFQTWGGDCTGNSLKVSVTLTKDFTCTVQFQSNFEVAAQEMLAAFYANAVLDSQQDIAAAYPLSTNEERLLEAFQLATLGILQVDMNLAATGQWPSQFNNIEQYATTPVGQYTQSITLQADQYVLLKVKLLTAAGVEEVLDIVMYYGETAPKMEDNLFTHSYINASFLPHGL